MIKQDSPSTLTSLKPVQLFTEGEYAGLIRKTVDAVRKARARGQGARFLRVGGSIRYRLEDIQDYLKKCEQQPSSEPDQ